MSAGNLLNAESTARTARSIQAFTDRFTGRRRPGTVIGTLTPEGLRRGGVDKQGVLSIDNDALRIQPLIEPGWGQAGLSYGPYERQNGLAFAVFLVNGHNTSQSETLKETFRERLWRWWVGSETYGPKRRVLQFLRSGRIGRMLPQWRWWKRINKDAPPVPRIDENLAIGWFPREVPEDPLKDGNAFIMHATGPENGELWARSAHTPLRVVRGVQNLQIYYIVVLREKGAAYYAASLPGANGLGALPSLRPLAIDPYEQSSPVYPGLFQSVLGQIGFRLDTRVYGTTVALLPECAEWYGTAHAADLLEGSGLLRRSEAVQGGIWRVCEGEFLRGARGVQPTAAENTAILESGTPSGLLHMLVTSETTDGAAGLVWRYHDSANYWRLRAGHHGCELAVRIDGAWDCIATSDEHRLTPSKQHALQVLDDGNRISAYLDGQLLFGQWFQDKRLHAATGAGIYSSAGPVRLQRWEAHPRAVALPRTLHLGEPWVRHGDTTVVSDNFAGTSGELSGRVTPLGAKAWRKVIGEGAMDLTGDGALKIRATSKTPNRRRTAYTVPWDHPEFADLEVEITPPGTKRGEREHGLCGFIFWQDPDNYITINIWVYDTYEGASISCFFHLDGFEDLYDAIWANVGSKVYFGVPLTLRMVFDGERYLIYVNGEPVLYRALRDVYPDYPRFSIRQVGLLANWEWGNDTGSHFRNFTARV